MNISLHIIPDSFCDGTPEKKRGQKAHPQRWGKGLPFPLYFALRSLSLSRIQAHRARPSFLPPSSACQENHTRLAFCIPLLPKRRVSDRSNFLPLRASENIYKAAFTRYLGAAVSLWRAWVCWRLGRRGGGSALLQSLTAKDAGAASWRKMRSPR